MKLFQLKNGYRYTSDTIFLWNYICEYYFSTRKNTRAKVLDVGAGCGILGLLIKRDFPSVDLSLLEIQEQNLQILNKNCEENSLQAQILRADFANLALSKSATSLSLEDFVRASNSHLKPNGTLMFCYEAEKLAKICEILQKYGLNLTNLGFVYPNEKKNAKLALFKAQKNSRSPCEIIAPIYTFINEQTSEIAERIYKKADLESIDFE